MAHSNPRRRSLILALACALPLVALGSLDAAQLCDGVVVDAQGARAYVMSPARGIEAIDLATGQALWSSEQAAKPLAAESGTLLAQAEATALTVVTLEADNGRVVGRQQIELPAGVEASVADGLHHSFRTQATLDNGEAHISWASSARGALHGDVSEATRFEGAVRMDLSSGVAALAAPAGATSGPTELAGADRLTSVEGRQFLSADGGHILASRLNEGGDLWSRYRWDVYDRGGQHLGSLNHRASMAPFVVAGGNLVFESQPFTKVVEGKVSEAPFQLMAVRLATGDQAWAKPIRDTRYRGPFPP